MGDRAFGNSAEYYLNNLNSFEKLEIGDNRFESVKTFKIDGLNRLKTIKIGNNSFTHKKNRWGIEVEEISVQEEPIEVEVEDRNRDDLSKSFHILNCESLESIEIGEYSFTDFGGEFELKNLPQLQSIQIGTIGSESYNFSNSSFVIRSIELILNI